MGINGKPINHQREAHLYDAMRAGTLRYLKGEVGRKAVVIVALSGDSQSESTMEDALQALLENDVIAYVPQIYDAPGQDKCDVLHIFEKDSLKKLAEATGGRMLEVKGMDKLEAALDEISDELHHQYSLGYYPENRKQELGWQIPQDPDFCWGEGLQSLRSQRVLRLSVGRQRTSRQPNKPELAQPEPTN